MICRMDVNLLPSWFAFSEGEQDLGGYSLDFGRGIKRYIIYRYWVATLSSLFPLVQLIAKLVIVVAAGFVL